MNCATQDTKLIAVVLIGESEKLVERSSPHFISRRQVGKGLLQEKAKKCSLSLKKRTGKCMGK